MGFVELLNERLLKFKQMCLAIPGKVEKIVNNMAVVNFGGIKKDVVIDFVPDITPGEYVIVHAGFAIQKLDTKEAKKTLKIFKEMSNLK